VADLAKINGYAVVNPASASAISVLKFTAYAVVYAADAYQSLGKIVGYAVVIPPTVAGDPVQRYNVNG
jgi:hypothetical protein